MVRIRRHAPANQTRLFGHEPDMLLVPNAARLRMAQPALIDAAGSLAEVMRASERCQLGSERMFDLSRVGCSQRILGADDPLRPDGRLVG